MDIYNVGNRIMNTYVYASPNGYIMIDTGYEHSLRDVEKKINKENIRLSDIKYIFLTHAHDDHAGFFNLLFLLYPAYTVMLKLTIGQGIICVTICGN